MLKTKKKKTERQRQRAFLDKLCSALIRLRAMELVGGCQRCLAKKTSYKQLQWAHNQPRGRMSTRYDLRNAGGLCPGCHRYIDNNHDEKQAFFTKLFGEETYELVRMLSLTPQRVDFDLVFLELKQEFAKLKYIPPEIQKMLEGR